MGERPLVHLVDGYVTSTACGEPWRDVPVTLITHNCTCPACWTAYRMKRPTVLTVDGSTGDDPIECAAWSCPSLSMDGANNLVGYVAPEHEDIPPCCPAPTPRAKP